jgi:hypothetical protein
LFTRKLTISERCVLDFVEHPIEFLTEVLEGLDDASKASVALIFLNGNQGVLSPLAPGEDLNTVTRLLGVPAPRISQALERLNGSLTLLVEQADGPRWTFRHPTVADAFASLVSKSPELIELYVRGAKLDRLLNEVVCDTAALTPAIVRVPARLYPIVQQRLREHPIDHTLIRFLTRKCDGHFLAAYTDNAPELFDLSGRLSPDLAHDSFAAFLAKAHDLGLLPEEVRRAAVEKIEDATLTWLDTAVYHDVTLRSLFTEEEFALLSNQFRQDVINDLPAAIYQFSSTDEMSLYQSMRENLGHAAKFFGGSPEIDEKFENALSSIDERLSELEEEAPTRPTIPAPPKPSGSGSSIISIFDDVDE